MNQFKTNNIQFTRPFSYFIETYPIEQLNPGLKLLNEFCNQHRPVRGDGNCFYRAFSFLYLLNQSFTTFGQAFPFLQLKYMQNKQMLFVEKFLRRVWQSHLRFLKVVKDEAEKENLLQKLFNDVENFDKAIISYFRWANFQSLKRNKQKWLPYFSTYQEFVRYLQKVSKFNHESEGVQIAGLCQLFQVKLTIFLVNSDGLQPITYLSQLRQSRPQFFLFYRPGHYDIIYPYLYSDKQQKDRRQKGKGAKKDRIKQIMLGDFSKGPMSTLWSQLLLCLIVGYFSFLIEKELKRL